MRPRVPVPGFTFGRMPTSANSPLIFELCPFANGALTVNAKTPCLARAARAVPLGFAFSSDRGLPRNQIRQVSLNRHESYLPRY
jgi:hypothetical protein